MPYIYLPCPAPIPLTLTDLDSSMRLGPATAYTTRSLHQIGGV